MEKKIDKMAGFLKQQLTEKQSSTGMWRGRLSSSAISTAVAIFSLHMIDKERYISYIKNGALWLHHSMHDDGSWGDTAESHSNMTATLLSYASLFSVDTPSEKTNRYLTEKFGGLSDERLVQGVLAYYGKDLTFSAPILVMCALSGVIKNWNKVPQLPFELSVVPQRFFRFLRLPVVSYAIPALIAVGILRHKKGKKGVIYHLREAFVSKSLKVLERLQPVNGGFLEAAPLTAFVAMCMSGAGYKKHITTQKAAHFLTSTVRDDGAWPIDTDLAEWVTSLAIKALRGEIPDKERLATIVKGNAFTVKHPFTGARAGGWGWSDLPGAVPDADDTAGSLVALYILLDGKYSPEIGKGIEWLLGLQNIDGGMPTFCKGWGALPFDRSSPDISAHSLLAFGAWREALPEKLQRRCTGSMDRLLAWMQNNQRSDGSWIPLWFGDQDAGDERSPVYGTAVSIEYLGDSKHPLVPELIANGTQFLLAAQNSDGGWGGTKGVPSKVTLTSRALSALCVSPGDCCEAIEKGVDYLYRKFESGEFNRPEPIGLYFARLWYSEELYNITFALSALNHIKNKGTNNRYNKRPL